MSENPYVVLMQVLIPPHMVLASYEKEELANGLMSQLEQILGPLYRKGVQGRVIFFKEGSEVYRLEDPEVVE